MFNITLIALIVLIVIAIIGLILTINWGNDVGCYLICAVVVIFFLFFGFQCFIEIDISNEKYWKEKTSYSEESSLKYDFLLSKENEKNILLYDNGTFYFYIENNYLSNFDTKNCDDYEVLISTDADSKRMQIFTMVKNTSYELADEPWWFMESDKKKLEKKKQNERSLVNDYKDKTSKETLAQFVVPQNTLIKVLNEEGEAKYYTIEQFNYQIKENKA